MATSTETRPWQETIAEQLADREHDGNTHAVVYIPEDGAPELLAEAASENEAIVAAEDHSVRVNGGEVAVISFAALRDFGPGPNSDGDQEAALEPDPDDGKLFDVPRVGVIIDESDPSLLKLAFAGGIGIERGDKQWIDFYNRLAAGRSSEITVTVHVAGAKKTHRRDKEGDVDAIVETKSLIITDVHLEA